MSAEDTLNDIVDVAIDVLADYACDEPGDTRIERMARWIALNVAVDVHHRHDDKASWVSTDDPYISVVQIEGCVAVKTGSMQPRPMSTWHARQLAAALYICIERAEQL